MTTNGKTQANTRCYSVNNIGWDYSLSTSQPDEEEKLHLIQRDSGRNLLALDYVVSYLAQSKLWSGEANAIVNIAGLGCTTASIPIRHPWDHYNDWSFKCNFMEHWYYWVCC